MNAGFILVICVALFPVVVEIAGGVLERITRRRSVSEWPKG